jgi:membrane associated rhomboid family serine protease
MLIVPLQHDRMTVKRLPWVSIAILLLNLIAFAMVSGAAKESQLRLEQSLEAVNEFWGLHPFVTIPASFEKMFPKPVSNLRAMINKSWEPPPADILAAQQAEFETLIDRAMSAVSSSPYYLWGYVPANPSVVGLFTSLFIHAGWLHLLGNMLFLYLSAPFIEDLWGRILFPVFYLMGGAAASLIQASFFPGATRPIVGASGAIAAIMGAFLIRQAKAKILFFYAVFFVGIKSGTFRAPAWIMLPLWLLDQLVEASAYGSDGKVAFWAHIGGFGFGVAFAVLMKFSGLEERYFRRQIADKVSGYGDFRLDEATEFKEAGRLDQAMELYRQVIRERPGLPAAHVGAFETATLMGDRDEAASHVPPLMEGYLKAGQVNMARIYQEDVEQKLPGYVMPARILHSLAGQEEKTRDIDAAIVTYGRLADLHPGDILSLKGLLHQAKLAIAAGKPQIAAEALGRLRAHPLMGPDWQRQADELSARIGSVPKAPAAAPAAAPKHPAAPTPPPPPTTVNRREAEITALDDEGLAVTLGGTPGRIPWREVAALSVGLVTEPGAPPTAVVCLCARTAGGGWLVTAVASTRLPLRRLLGRGDVPSAALFPEFIALLLDRSGAAALPDRSTCQGKLFERFDSAAEFHSSLEDRLRALGA